MLRISHGKPDAAEKHSVEQFHRFQSEGAIIMRHLTGNNFLLGLIILLLLPLQVLAVPAITCHCFTDRSFDPAQPGLADPYFLATTQNSFFAVVFNVDKKAIVMKKQQGRSSDDLWIAYWIASGSAGTAETLLKTKQDKELWKDVIAQQRIPAKILGSRFAAALNARQSAPRLAEAVVDELLLRHRLLADAELSALRKKGASNQELIIATLLAAKTGKPAKQIFHEVKNGSKTWGSSLHEAKIDPKNMQQEISSLMKPQER